MNKCPKCESPVRDGSKFCGNCGASLAVPEHVEEVTTPSIPAEEPAANPASSSAQNARPIPSFGRKGRCKYCGHQVPIGRNPCPNCGHELRWGQKTVQIRVTSGTSQIQNSQPLKTNTPIVLGVLSLVAWLIPLVGFPVSICGIVSSARQKNGGCLALCIIGLVLTIGNSVNGAIDFREAQRRAEVEKQVDEFQRELRDFQRSLRWQ